MAGASNVLDPVETARDDISRSKHLIASTLEDLTQHHSWLESYHREERRRAERLRRQDALRRLELKRQRAAWHARRVALKTYAATRTTIAFLVRNGTDFTIWAAPRAHAGAREAWRLISAASSRSWRAGHALARDAYARAEQAFAWSIQASDAAGIVFRRWAAARLSELRAHAAILAEPAAKRATVGWTRTRYRTRRLAFALETSLSHGWSRTQSAVSRWIVEEGPELRRAFAREMAAGALRTRLKARNLARAGLDAGTTGRSWLLSRASQVIEKQSAPQQRALIVRPCTALVCIGPVRTRLPSIIAS